MSIEPKMCAANANAARALTRLFDRLHKKGRGPEQTGTAEVTGKRVALGGGISPDDRWSYTVRFRLSSGEEVALSAAEDTFHALKEGQSGALRWQGEILLSFEND